MRLYHFVISVSISDMSALKSDEKSEKSISNSLRKNSSKRESDLELPPSDPGNLLDLMDSSDYLLFHRNEHGAPEVHAGCCDALIVYAAEANKKS